MPRLIIPIVFPLLLQLQRLRTPPTIRLDQIAAGHSDCWCADWTKHAKHESPAARVVVSMLAPCPVKRSGEGEVRLVVDLPVPEVCFRNLLYGAHS
jgi:hypothetical protein